MADTHVDRDGAVLAGRYRLGTLLGRGGVADVYRAGDELLGRDVAVKVIRSETYDANRHASEMATLARLNHPGLVALYDAGNDDGRGFFVMELVDGPTLAERGRLAPARVAEIGARLADALAYVHRQGVVHRDLKPANVLLGADGRVKLADFGIARLVDAARLTATGTAIGTAAYFAPEQVAGDQIGAPADIYSLGLVLLECLTGRREYDGTSVETAMARLHRDPSIPADLPPPWPELLAPMTEREPARRPTASVVADRLRQFPARSAADTPTRALSGPPSAPTAQLPGQPRRRGRANRRLAIGLLAILLLVAAGVLLAHALSGGTTTPTVRPTLPSGPSGPVVPQPLENDLRQLEKAVRR